MTAPLRIGPLVIDPPVVLAPMAGVTNRAFRRLCREFGGGGLYVNEMILARALTEGHERTARMLRFDAHERPRSAQLYSTAPGTTAEAVRLLIHDHGVEHVDLNFGCPMPKVTRKGGGAALPVRRRLLADIVGAAVRAAEPDGVPVTVKFRIGIDDRIRTSVDTGRIAESEGAAAVALHARTAEQCYAGDADWAVIAELKAAVQTIPVLGNGDIWEAADALRMIEATGCDGVVIGRGCLGRPWLFADLAAAFAPITGTPRTPGTTGTPRTPGTTGTPRTPGTTGTPRTPGRPVEAARSFGFVAATMLRHAELLTLDEGEDGGVRSFRRHAAWYLQGYPVGTEVRRRAGMVTSLAELSAILGDVDPALTLPAGHLRLPRGHTEGPRPVHLPDGWLELIDDPTPPEGAELLVSGG